MLWARDFIKNTFPGSNVRFHRNAKVYVSEGAAIAAARALSLLPELNISLQDLSRLSADIGLMVTQNNRERFVPLASQHSYWWQQRAPIHFILGETTDTPVCLKLLIRGENGKLTPISDIHLEGLPSRPHGATRISAQVTFENYNSAICVITDLGFGDMFPKSSVSAEKSFSIQPEKGGAVIELGSI